MTDTAKDLLSLPKERKFSEAQLNYWKAELEKCFPHMPEGLIWQTLDAYSTHPHIFDELMEDHKANPDKYKPKEPEPIRYPKLPEEKDDTVTPS
jgi:hypothetical protein